MIDPPYLTAQNLLEILKFRLILQIVKDDWSPNPLSTAPRSLPEILKFRLSLHMVKDDWPPSLFECPEFTRNFKV